MASSRQGPDPGPYQTPEKQECRERLIKHAVECLTTGRETSTCVQRHQVRQAWDAYKESEEAHRLFGEEEVRQIEDEIQNWEHIHDGQTNKMTKNMVASHLRVCFLAGENPMNDINVFLKNGVLSQKIWGIEKDVKKFEKATAAVKKSPRTRLVKLFRGDFLEFIRTSPDKFDIIYFDATGPLPSKDKKTLKAIGSVFLYNKLASPGALITTFSFPPKEIHDIEETNDEGAFSFPPEDTKNKNKKKKMKEEKENLTKLAKGYLKFRLENTIGHSSNLERSDEDNYSDYITYQVIDTAYMYAPALRLLSPSPQPRKTRWQQIFIEEECFSENVKTLDTKECELSDNFLLKLWTHMDQLDKLNTLVNEAFPERQGKKPSVFLLTHLLPNSIDLLSKYSNENFKTSFLTKVCKNCFQVDEKKADTQKEIDCKYKKSVDHAEKCEHFNTVDKITNKKACSRKNEPSHYLVQMVTSLLHGEIANPYFIVPQKGLRFKYPSSHIDEDQEPNPSARRQMFSDVFIFDNCQYVFNQMSSVHSAYDTIEDPTQKWLIETIIKHMRETLSFICKDVFECCQTTTLDEPMEIPRREEIQG